MKYILGIETTFRTSGIGLVDKSGKVIFNEKINIDFADEKAEKFFQLHMKDTLSLVKPVMEKYGNDIFLISVANQQGPFHSMPVGVIIANTLSYFFNKEIIGIDHEISHLYSNWLDRDQSIFNFPIISLSISGAHTNIWLIKEHGKVHLLKKLIFNENKEQFSGLGALFYFICFNGFGLKINKGEGGPLLEKLALNGKPKYSKQLKFDVKKENESFKFFDIRNYLTQKIKELGYYSLRYKEREQFQKDFACSFLEAIFDELATMIGKAAADFDAKEVHLAGGAAVNTFLISSLKKFCEDKSLILRQPVKSNYCGDNGAMNAIFGYYQWSALTSEEKKDNKFISIKPFEWYYKYYVNYFLK